MEPGMGSSSLGAAELPKRATASWKLSSKQALGKDGSTMFVPSMLESMNIASMNTDVQPVEEERRPFETVSAFDDLRRRQCCFDAGQIHDADWLLQTDEGFGTEESAPISFAIADSSINAAEFGLMMNESADWRVRFDFHESQPIDFDISVEDESDSRFVQGLNQLGTLRRFMSQVVDDVSDVNCVEGHNEEAPSEGDDSFYSRRAFATDAQAQILFQDDCDSSIQLKPTTDPRVELEPLRPEGAQPVKRRPQRFATAMNSMNKSA